MTQQLATVWLFHEAGRAAAGHTDAERAWADMKSLPPGSRERADMSLWFNPVEINIKLDDIPRAVANWEYIAQLSGVCHVEIKPRTAGMTVNKVYDPVRQSTPGFTSLRAEDFQVGYRYWAVRPGRESDWTVAQVVIAPAGYQVHRDGRWLFPELVTITYRDGRTRVFEKGEQVAIQGPWLTS